MAHCSLPSLEFEKSAERELKCESAEARTKRDPSTAVGMTERRNGQEKGAGKMPEVQNAKGTKTRKGTT
jgi:hypothetical protein